MTAPVLDSPQVVAFLDYVRKGVDFDLAVSSSGLDIETVRQWLERGMVENSRLQGSPTAKPRKSETPYMALYRSFRVFGSQALADLQVGLHKAAQDDWRAGLALLERIMPERFAKPADRKALREIESEGVHYEETASNAVNGITR